MLHFRAKPGASRSPSLQSAPRSSLPAAAASSGGGATPHVLTPLRLAAFSPAPLPPERQARRDISRPRNVTHAPQRSTRYAHTAARRKRRAITRAHTDVNERTKPHNRSPKSPRRRRTVVHFRHHSSGTRAPSASAAREVSPSREETQRSYPVITNITPSPVPPSERDDSDGGDSKVPNIPAPISTPLQNSPRARYVFFSGDVLIYAVYVSHQMPLFLLFFSRQWILYKISCSCVRFFLSESASSHWSELFFLNTFANDVMQSLLITLNLRILVVSSFIFLCKMFMVVECVYIYWYVCLSADNFFMCCSSPSSSRTRAMSMSDTEAQVSCSILQSY